MSGRPRRGRRMRRSSLVGDKTWSCKHDTFSCARHWSSTVFLWRPREMRLRKRRLSTNICLALACTFICRLSFVRPHSLITVHGWTPEPLPLAMRLGRQHCPGNVDVFSSSIYSDSKLCHSKFIFSLGQYRQCIELIDAQSGRYNSILSISILYP